MIRTALLAGILLVLLSIAYNRPGTLPELARVAATKVEEQTRRTVDAVAEIEPAPTPAPQSVAIPAPQPAPVVAVVPPAPVVATVEPVVADVPAAEPAPVSVATAPAVAPQPVVAVPPVQVTPAAVVAVPVAALPANMPVRLYPPAPVAPPVAQAAPAEMPVMNVAPRPARAPFDVAVGTVHQETPAPSVTEIGDDQPAPNYMSPKERSRELYRLAREMEEKFLDKLAR